MNKVYLSKSGYCKCVHCEKISRNGFDHILWYMNK